MIRRKQNNKSLKLHKYFAGLQRASDKAHFQMGPRSFVCCGFELY